ncbi:MAG: DUF2721 domain-containing protein [Chitinophagales bacterium]|nr:DUF2721 domain-containing protein [Chitinophagales bacterium]MDW8427354.1 DUF2721 domain-containing protein [Chitinophagales bacterium]
MNLTLSTPALLFPAIAFLLIAYTNRYLAIARLMRELKTSWKQEHSPLQLRQIHWLRRREALIRYMQTFAIASMFCCVLSLGLIFLNHAQAGAWLFGLALFLMAASLAISLRDIVLAGGALRIELEELQEALRAAEAEGKL